VATYADLVNRVLFLLNRQGDPLITQAATDLSKDRCYYYANSFFFASEKTDTSLILNPGQQSYPLPAGVLDVLVARYNLNGTWIPMERTDYRNLLYMDVNQPPTTSTPFYWAIFGRMFRMFPAPNQVSTVELTAETQPLPPRLPDDSNFWTNEAFSLIVAATCEDICRTFLNDIPRAEAHATVRDREYKNMNGQTIRLIGPIQVRGHL
jgi:hypothetical protein